MTLKLFFSVPLPLPSHWDVPWLCLLHSLCVAMSDNCRLNYSPHRKIIRLCFSCHVRTPCVPQCCLRASLSVCRRSDSDEQVDETEQMEWSKDGGKGKLVWRQKKQVCWLASCKRSVSRRDIEDNRASWWSNELRVPSLCISILSPYSLTAKSSLAAVIRPVAEVVLRAESRGEKLLV